MRMRKIWWRMKSCCYPCWKHLHDALAQYTLLEMLDVFSMCVVVELSVAPANRGRVFPTKVSSLPHCARHAFLNRYHLVISIWVTEWVCELQDVCAALVDPVHLKGYPLWRVISLFRSIWTKLSHSDQHISPNSPKRCVILHIGITQTTHRCGSRFRSPKTYGTYSKAGKYGRC